MTLLLLKTTTPNVFFKILMQCGTICDLAYIYQNSSILLKESIKKKDHSRSVNIIL